MERAFAAAVTDVERVLYSKLLMDGSPIGEVQDVRFDAGRNLLTWTKPSGPRNFTHYQIRVDSDFGDVPAFEVSGGQNSLPISFPCKVWICAANAFSEIRGPMVSATCAPSSVSNAWGTPVIGADPTGVVDATSVIVSTLTAVSAAGGGRVIMPMGNYLVGEFDMPEGVQLVGHGEGTRFTRNGAITDGRGWVNFTARNSSIDQIALEGLVTTPTGLEYGSGTAGNRFNNDPMNVKLTKNSTFWVHPGAHGCKILRCSIRHSGGYAVVIDWRTGDLNDWQVCDNLIENCRAHLFGLSAGAYLYGSWTSGIHGQGDDSGGSSFKPTGGRITGNRIRRITGNGIFVGHAYGFNAQADSVIIANNIIDTVGRDGIQVGNIDGVSVYGNTIRRGGMTTLTDSDAPVPRYLSLAYAVGIDCSGLGQHCSITGNVVININGAAFDHDGLCFSAVTGNVAIESKSGEPGYTEDDVVNFGLGAGSLSYGYQVSNSQINTGGEGNGFFGNICRGMRGGGIRLYAARDTMATGNMIHHPASAVVSPIVVGNIGATAAEQSSNVVIAQNTIIWNPATRSPCVVEDASIAVFSGATPNYIFDNKCLGNCYEALPHSSSGSSTAKVFASNSPSLLDRQDFLIENTGVGISAALKGYTIQGATLRTMFQLADYRDGATRDSVLNVSLDGAAGTGIVVTGDRTTFGFGDLSASGHFLGYGFLALLDKGNAASVFDNARANLFTDDWAELRYTKGVGIEQSITTSAGARVWTLWGGSGGSVLPFTLDSVNGRVGLNKPVPSSAFDAISLEAVNATDFELSKENSFLLFIQTAYSSGGSAHAPLQILRRARGDFATPAAVTTGDQLGGLSFRGFDGATFVQSAIISAFVESAVSSGVVPMYLSFQVGTGAGTTAEALRINSSRNVLIATGTDDATGAKLQVSGFVSATSGYFTTSTASDAFKALAGGGTALVWISVRNDGGPSFYLSRTAGVSRNWSLTVAASGAFLLIDETSGNSKIGIYTSGEVRIPTGDFNVQLGALQLAATTVITNAGVFVGSAVTATGPVSGTELRVSGNVIVDSGGVLRNPFGIDVAAGIAGTGFNIHGGATGTSGTFDVLLNGGGSAVLTFTNGLKT